MRIASFAFFVIGALILYSFKANATASIHYVYDGDTVQIIEGQTKYKLRITHIDAPERNQPHGLKSRRALIQLCQQADIEVTITGTDRYQRKLGTLHCDQQNVATYMVENGHAWFNDRFSNDMLLALKERQAREQQRGLWANEKATPPWTWRKQHQNTPATQ